MTDKPFEIRDDTDSDLEFLVELMARTLGADAAVAVVATHDVPRLHMAAFGEWSAAERNALHPSRSLTSRQDFTEALDPWPLLEALSALQPPPVHTQILDPQGRPIGWVALKWRALAAPTESDLAQMQAMAQAFGTRLSHPTGSELDAHLVQSPDPPDAAPHLRRAMHAMQMGGWTYNVGLRRLQLSAEAADVLRLPSPLPRSVDELLRHASPDTGDRLQRAFTTAVQQGVCFDEEVQLVRADGTPCWVRFVGLPVVGDPAGLIEELYGALQDVTSRRAAQEETMRLAMRLSTTLASITDAFVTLDREGCFTYVNAESERLLQQPAAVLLNEPIWSYLQSRTTGLVRQHIGDAQALNRKVEFEDFFPRLDKWLEIRSYPFAEGFAVYFRDVSERHRSQEQLRLLETGISRLNDLIVIAEFGDEHDDGSRIVFVNHAFEQLTGFGCSDILGRSPRDLLRHRANSRLMGDILRALDRREQVDHFRHEIPIRRRDGSSFWMDLDIVYVRADDGAVTHWIAVGRDVSQRREDERKIHDLAYFDPLTQLPNRRMLMEQLVTALSRCARSGQEGALMFIDLDHFKVLNDTMGHVHGDLLLLRVADRLRHSVRRSDIVARLGGDEFVVMLQGLGTDPETARQKARTVANKILARMAEPFDLDGAKHYSTTSIGVAGFNAGHPGVDDLLKQADLAMYQAKSAGRNTVSFFDPAMQAALSASAALSSDLRVALGENQFAVHYQPLLDRDGRVRGVEALLRWHRDDKWVPPGVFIPIAESNGQILPIGMWVIEQACRQLAAWAEDPSTASLGIAVNVSVRQFLHPGFVDQVTAAIRRSAIAPHLLRLELTESLLAERIDITRARMQALKALGVTFSLDDFGTGYSSLAYLKHLPLDQLKIDKGFVADLLTNPHDAAISSAIIGLAHSLQLDVIAEGVETDAQRNHLMQLGCDLFQGFLFAPALSITEFERFLAASPRLH